MEFYKALILAAGYIFLQFSKTWYKERSYRFCFSNQKKKKKKKKNPPSGAKKF